MTTALPSWPARAKPVFAACALLACGAPAQPEAPVPSPPPVAPVDVIAPNASATAPVSVATSAPVIATPDLVIVSVTNPAGIGRNHETIALSEAELKKTAPAFELGKALVFDAAGAPVLSQLVATTFGAAPNELVFQADFIAGETKSFRVRLGERKLPPTASYEVYGRFVRERHDDFAWENDLVAHRMYGPELETTKKEPLVSSGIDVWAKRVPRLLVNEWYMTDDYHQDHGDGADYYFVGKSRGCGGLGIWDKKKLAVSRNFTTSRVLANGPLRLIFELDYAPWDAGGSKVSETKRVTLDAGTFFNHFESTFTAHRSTLPVALGIAKHPGATFAADAATASIRVWEPVENGKNGYLGCAVVLGPGVASAEKQTDDNYLLVTNAKPGAPLGYYVGSTWDRAGHVANADAWAATTRELAQRLASPVKVTLAAGPGAGTPNAGAASTSTPSTSTPSTSTPSTSTPTSAAQTTKPRP